MSKPCYSKRAYHSMRVALIALEGLDRLYDGPKELKPIRAYGCRCGYFHLTHFTEEEYREHRRRYHELRAS